MQNKISISEIGSCAGYQFSVEKVGKLKNLSVRILTHVVEHVRQDSRLAGVTVAASSILFLHITMRATIFADKFFSRCLGLDQKISQNTFLAKNIVCVTFFSSLLVGMSVGLVKGLQLPLSPLATVGISTASCASVLLFIYLKTQK
jgi:uncharacterized membrane protein YqhA